MARNFRKKFHGRNQFYQRGRQKLSHSVSIDYRNNDRWDKLFNIFLAFCLPFIGALAVRISTSLLARITVFALLMLISGSIYYYWFYKKSNLRIKKITFGIFAILSLGILASCFIYPIHDGCLQGQLVSDNGKPYDGVIMAIPSETGRCGQGTRTDDDGNFLLAGLEKELFDVYAFEKKKESLRYSKHSMYATDQDAKPITFKYPFKQCKVYKLGTIRFENASSRLDHKRKEKIAQIAQKLKRELPIEDYRLFILGHTSEPGSDKYNLKLGRKRAEVVRSELISYYFNPERLHSVSFGERMLVNFGDAIEDHAANRRVDFLILPYGKKAEEKMAGFGLEYTYALKLPDINPIL